MTNWSLTCNGPEQPDWKLQHWHHAGYREGRQAVQQRLAEQIMFDQYSERATKVVFLARFIAGQKGAPTMGVEHLVEGLIREDQGEVATVLGVPPEELGVPLGEKPHRAFFSPEAASQILFKLRQDVPNAQPIGTAVDMPVSPALGKVFEVANALHSEAHQNKVEPLHLLAGVLSIEPGIAAEALQQAGITREVALAALRSE